MCQGDTVKILEFWTGGRYGEINTYDRSLKMPENPSEKPKTKADYDLQTAAFLPVPSSIARRRPPAGRPPLLAGPGHRKRAARLAADFKWQESGKGVEI